MDDAAAETLVEWREWGVVPFEDAERSGRPVLLALTAPWCDWCRDMDRTTYSDPRIAAHLSEGFVPVRVDVDRHPRVRERYNMGGFPSTVFVTPDGEVITGATHLGPEGMRAAIESVRKTWDAKGSGAGRIPRALRDPEPPAGELTPAVEARMVGQVEAAFDPEFGGWGTDAKFPLPRAVEFALKRDRDRALRTLEAVRTHLQDTYDGGFYRYAGGRDWSDLHREKLLDTNAGIVRAFASAYLYTGEDAYRSPVERAVDYLTTTLWTGDAFAGSQSGGEYYTLGTTERESADPPPVDGTVFADRNGLAVDALLRAGAYLDHETASRYAERALDHVHETLVGDGEVTHYRPDEDDPDTAESGLLADQARVLRALTTAAQVLDAGYADRARPVADWTIEHRRSADGTFLDGPPEGPGLLDRPLRPLDATVELADALVDLSVLTGEDRYRAVAREALSAYAGAAERMGVEVAAYAAAASRVLERPLVLRVSTPTGTDIHRAALRIADHEKVVVPDAHSESGTAVVDHDGRRSTPASTPEELVERVAEHVGERDDEQRD
jgi:uncharacterized protein YyaL (SSP411 family)